MGKWKDVAPVSEMDAQRALLDSLMGVNRNNDREGEEISDLLDERLCRCFMVGLCPHEMFVNTKMDIGTCPLVHDELLREKFQASNDKYAHDSFCERTFGDYVAEIDRKIRRSRERLEDSKKDEDSPETHPDVVRMQLEISRLTNEIEAAGEEGEIDRAQELMASLEAMTAEKKALQTKIAEQRALAALQQQGGAGAAVVVDVNEKLRVCDICGSFLSIYDSDKRLQDHFLGKLHIGYQAMRDTLSAIDTRRRASLDAARKKEDQEREAKAARKAALSSRSDRREGSRERDRSRGRDRDRDRSRGRDSRDHYRSDRRSRSRERERRRDRSRSRSRSRDRRRDRSRSRSRERDRRRDRSRTRSRDRDRDRRRERSKSRSRDRLRDRDVYFRDRRRSPSPDRRRDRDDRDIRRGTTRDSKDRDRRRRSKSTTSSGSSSSSESSKSS